MEIIQRNTRFVILLFSCFLLSGNLHGKPILSGKVVNELGEPVSPCIVQLEGLSRKITVRDSSGNFMFTNLNPGKLKIIISSRYYATRFFEVYLPDDKYTRATFIVGKGENLDISDSVYKPKSVYFNADMIGNMYIKDQELQQSVLVPSLVPILLPGFNTSGKSIKNRNIPEINNKILLDGIDYTDNFRANIMEFGNRIVNLPSSYSLGTYSSGYELNSALSSDPYYSYELMQLEGFKGYSRFETDIEALNGRAANGISIIESEKGNTYKLTDNTAKYLASERSIFDFGIGGKIDPTKNSTLFFSGYSLIENHNPGYDLQDPFGNNLGNMPDEYYWRRNISGRMTFEVGDGFVLTFGAYYGITSIANSSWEWLYSTDKSPEGYTERNAKQIKTNLNLSNVYFKFNKSLSPETWYEFKLIYQYHLEESGRTANFWEPTFLKGYDILQPEDKYRAMNYEFVPGADGIFDEYQSIYEIRPTSDGLLQGEFRKVNPFTGFIEGSTDYSGTANPWGIPNIFVTHGNTSIRIRQYDDISTEFEYNSLRGYFGFDHLFKSNIEFGYSFIKSDAYGFHKVNLNLNNPVRAGIRVEDKMIYGGLIVTPSVSLRYFGDHPAEGLISDSTETGFFFSPNMAVNFNLTNNSSINFSYSSILGIENENKRISDYGDIPKSDFTSINIFYEYNFVKDFFIDAGYFFHNHKDMLIISSAADFDYFSYRRFIIDQRTSGFDISLSKPLVDNYSFRINYTNLNTIIEKGIPGNNYYLYPHTLKTELNLNWNQNEGPRLFGIFPLENTGVNVFSYFNSGTPYTKTDINGMAAGFAFSENNPEYWEVMLRLEKRIFLSDIFGDKLGKMSVSIILDIYNLFNRAKPVMYYPATGDPVDNGLMLSKSKNDFPATGFYKSFDPRYPESGSGNQYDNFGNRLYNSNSDINNDNKVDQDEKYRSWLKYVETKLNLLENFQKPRSVLLSFVVRY